MKRTKKTSSYCHPQLTQKRLLTTLCLIVALYSGVSAKDNDTNKKVRILPVPAFGYSPETKTYIGAVTLFSLDFYQDSLTRESNAKLELNYTWNKQLILETEWNYFTRKEKWFTKGKLHYSDYPDLYYGIGGETPKNNELSFNSIRLIAEVSILKNVGNKWFFGPSVNFSDYSRIEATNSPLSYPELKNGSALGLGFSVLHDNRNSMLTPTSGFYLFACAIHNLSATNYQELTLDFRYYKSWKGNYVWANRLLNDFTFNTPPFFDYSVLGGDKYVRGYYLGRYRDKNLTTWQSEFRFPVYKRVHMATFGGIAGLYSENNPLKISKTKLNYGFGFRYLVDKTGNTFLRLDYAIGQDQNDGFYISFGESF